MKYINKSLTILIPNLNGGGAEKVVTHLANSFIERGVKVNLILFDKVGPYISILNSNINCINLNTKKSSLSLFKVIKYLKKNPTDTLVSFLENANLVALLAKICLKRDFRLIISKRNFNFYSENNKSIIGIFNNLVFKLYFVADAIICVSESLRKEVIRKDKSLELKTFTIYNPIITNKKQKLIHNKKYNFPYILSIGRLEKQKNYELLIKAFNNVVKVNNIKLIILGDGSMRRELYSLVKKLNLTRDIIFEGFVNNCDVFLCDARLFVLSSNFEGFPNVMLDALAYNIPIVATDCESGPREILENGKWGTLVQPNNIDRLSNAIIESLKTKIRLDVSRRVEDFRLEEIVNQYLKILFI